MCVDRSLLCVNRFLLCVHRSLLHAYRRDSSWGLDNLTLLWGGYD